MSTPRVKRALAGPASDPTQRPITSFFARDADATAAFPAGRAAEPSQPLLPPSVQANLLAVGMRVRKSVPEGYKTGKGDAAVHSPRPVHVHAYSAFLQPSSASVASVASSTSDASQRELVPFCGLHKVGGLGVQDDDDGRPLFASGVFNGSTDDLPPSQQTHASSAPGLTSSQETVSSMSSYLSRAPMPAHRPSAAGTRKRMLGDDERVSAQASVQAWLADEGPRRVLAVPRRRPQTQQTLQTQLDGTVAKFGDDDFEEAAFLDADAMADIDMGL